MNKAYIVTNKKQELDVLKKFEQNGLFWRSGNKPTEWITSKEIMDRPSFNFPYALVKQEGSITWALLNELMNETIIYDGRKENDMNKKYLVTQEFINKLIEWSDENDIKLDEEDASSYVIGEDIMILPNKVDEWWDEIDNPRERNNRLIAIIQWLNGEDVFETQKTYKYYVARDGFPTKYLSMKKEYHLEFPMYYSDFSNKKIFDTREEAEKWLVPGYEVGEIDKNEL